MRRNRNNRRKGRYSERWSQ